MLPSAIKLYHPCKPQHTQRAAPLIFLFILVIDAPVILQVHILVP